VHGGERASVENAAAGKTVVSIDLNHVSPFYGDMNVKEISNQIIKRLPQLTPQLVLGAKFIVDHPDRVVTSSMRNIANQIGVAPATLLRLARALNFKDWAELRDSYVQQFRSSAPHYAEKADSLVHRQGVLGLIDEVSRAQRAALDHNAGANSVESIDESAKILNRAPRIFVAAFMSCRAPGLAFAYICRLFRSNVLLLGAEGSSLVADLQDIRSDDAVLAIDFIPYAHDIHSVARAVQRSGASLISIADSRVTPLSPFAKSILLFGAESPSFFPSITPAVALIESLAAAMLAHAGDGAVTRIRAIEEALYASGSYDATSAVFRDPGQQ
jgi:DNA-binding MurR/RpiR family transcriptional regulator